MDTTQMGKQFFELQKTTFNNAYNTLTMVQDQAETFGIGLIRQNAAIPQQAKDAVEGMLKMCKTARDNYKKAVDESFSNMEGYLSGAGAAKKK